MQLIQGQIGDLISMDWSIGIMSLNHYQPHTFGKIIFFNAGLSNIC